ncbi:dTDP-glucose 4,6-dehydratase 1 [Thermococcus nautili]|uniref:dTDP-glucose 4,6-dehydratase n=1 Tax=Thermococcus nautili TaxID=195522 RepID=UPI0025550576|nr:dTDP-glucose 4,6-dehydratase [Thermococcus nautili]CAI1492446.1 dTDP-glucose 4,6-dehydratase 1 [Thermococcus nautili]
MKLLVTGGMGFIGSNFIRYVLKKHEDWEVINLDKLSYGSNPANLRDLKDDPRYTFVRGDIADFELMSELVKKVDAIVNFAAESHVDRSISSPDHFLRSNVIGVYTILEAIRKANPEVRLVHISTDEVYGDILEGSFREEDALKPSSPYSATKAAADSLVLGWARTYNLNASITRCTNNYGPYQFPEKLIPKTIIRASMGLKVPIYGTGQNVRDWIYVEDHVRAVETVLLKGEPREIYNVSAGEERTNLEVVKTILRLLGKDESLIEFVEDRPGHDLRYSLDSWRIMRDLKWRPRYSFEKGIKLTVEWYLKNEDWWRPLVNERVLHPTPWKLGW